jgi:hypothetical protein
MAISLSEFWDENYYKHPPLSDEMAAAAQHVLGVTLPSELIALLRVQNGGYTRGFAYPMTRRTTWAEDHVPLNELFGIVTDTSIETAQNILDTAYMTAEWGLPPRQVLLSGEGHWWITLDYRGGDTPTVAWIDVECDDDVQIASSFSEFLTGLVSIETFAK